MTSSSTSNARSKITLQAWQSALRFVKRRGYRKEIEEVSKASPPSNKDDFLKEYAWVIFVAGFDEILLRKKWPRIKKAFDNFNVVKISKRPASFFLRKEMSIRNKSKIVAIVKATKIIRHRGHEFFLSDPQNLKQLPRIRETSMRLLARNMGILDTAKDDIWMKRLAKNLGYGVGTRSVDKMVDVVRVASGYKLGVIDVVLWRAMQQGWRPRNRRSVARHS